MWKLKCKNDQCRGPILKFKDWDDFIRKVEGLELDYDDKTKTLKIVCSRCDGLSVYDFSEGLMTKGY